MKIGERIKERREALGMSQDELAKRLGLTSRSTICKTEKDGEGMTPKTVKAYADALKCSPAYLLGLTDEASPAADLILTEEEKQIIIQYRNAPKSDRDMIRRILAYYKGGTNEN